MSSSYYNGFHTTLHRMVASLLQEHYFSQTLGDTFFQVDIASDKKLLKSVGSRRGVAFYTCPSEVGFLYNKLIINLSL